MRLIFVNFHGIACDIKELVDANRNKLILAIFIFLSGCIMGVMSGLGAVNPTNALRTANPDFYILITNPASKSYAMSLIFSNVLLLGIIYLCCFHYYLTPLSIVVLFVRVFSIASHISLLIICFGIASVPVIIIGIIPYCLISFVFFVAWSLYLISCARCAYYFEGSPFLIFRLRQMAIVMAIFLVLGIILCGGFSVIIVSFSGGLA